MLPLHLTCHVVCCVAVKCVAVSWINSGDSAGGHRVYKSFYQSAEGVCYLLMDSNTLSLCAVNYKFHVTFYSIIHLFSIHFTLLIDKLCTMAVCSVVLYAD